MHTRQHSRERRGKIIFILFHSPAISKRESSSNGMASNSNYNTMTETISVWEQHRLCVSKVWVYCTRRLGEHLCFITHDHRSSSGGGLMTEDATRRHLEGRTWRSLTCCCVPLFLLFFFGCLWWLTSGWIHSKRSRRARVNTQQIVSKFNYNTICVIISHFLSLLMRPDWDSSNVNHSFRNDRWSKKSEKKSERLLAFFFSLAPVCVIIPGHLRFFNRFSSLILLIHR